MSGYENKGHILYTDNYYTSLKLLDKLATLGIAMCGSVRLERVHKSLKQSITKEVLKTMKRGDSIYYHNENRCVVVWKDAKYVKLLFNHLPSPSDSTSLRRWGEGGSIINLPCPRAIRDYFYSARSIDVVNQLHYSYPLGRKSKSARSRLVWWLFDICVVNAYTIWAAGQPTMTQLTFRLELMHEMASAHRQDQRLAAESAAAVRGIPLAKDHYPVKVAEQKDCAQCSHRPQHRKRSVYVCPACNVHLCVDGCFDAYHKELHDRRA